MSSDSAVPIYTLRDVLALVDGLIVRERCEKTEGAKMQIDETKATILGLALGATFTAAMEMVEAVAVVVFAAGKGSDASNGASDGASAADVSLAAESFLNFAHSSLNFAPTSLDLAPSSLNFAPTSLNLAPSSLDLPSSSPKFANPSLAPAPAARGVPALTVADLHCRHVVDLNVWYCTCGLACGLASGLASATSGLALRPCPHLVAAAIAVRNRLVSAHHTTWPALPWGPLPGAVG